jgi:hypothetical protein
MGKAMKENSIIVRNKLVGLSGLPQRESLGLLFDAMARLFPIEFCMVEGRPHEPLDALIVLDGDETNGLAAAAKGLPTLVMMKEGEEQVVNGSRPVSFGETQYLEPCLRNQVMTEKDGIGGFSIPCEAGDQVLASRITGAIWVSRPRGSGICQLAGVPLPSLGKGDYLFQHLNGRRFMGLLPLMHFLREVVKDIDWKCPAPRACFVFDDPSLYWQSYGFINFHALAAHAVKHNYYVSVATIPLDAWWVNRRVADILRSSNPRLSLVIHGNNHTHKELVSRANGKPPISVAAQALQRMERLEQRHGVAISRIMEAPHGAICEAFFAPMLALNYEATLATTELLVRNSLQTVWPAGVGMDMSEILGGGLPVLPRIRMSAYWKNEVLLAAFLGQPIVLAGHHQDAVGQLKLLSDFAGFINHLPAATWASPQGIVRSNYKELRRGNALFLKLYSRTVHVAVPEGVSDICINRPWVGSEGTGETLVIKSRGEELLRVTGPEMIGPVPVAAGQALEISSVPLNQVDFRNVRASGARCWPVARKLMMELRDRSAPLRRRVNNMLSAIHPWT